MGLWSVLVGLFLFDAAYSIVKHASGNRRPIVSDAMSPPFSIDSEVLISQFIDSILPLHRQVAFPVTKQKQLHGILSLDDLKALPRERWHLTKAREMMRPIAQRFFVTRQLPDYARVDEKRHWVCGGCNTQRRVGGLPAERNFQTKEAHQTILVFRERRIAVFTPFVEVDNVDMFTM